VPVGGVVTSGTGRFVPGLGLGESGIRSNLAELGAGKVGIHTYR
jgi:hypothetical protein